MWLLWRQLLKNMRSFLQNVAFLFVSLWCGLYPLVNPSQSRSSLGQSQSRFGWNGRCLDLKTANPHVKGKAQQQEKSHRNDKYYRMHFNAQEKKKVILFSSQWQQHTKHLKKFTVGHVINQCCIGSCWQRQCFYPLTGAEEINLFRKWITLTLPVHNQLVQRGSD